MVLQETLDNGELLVAKEATVLAIVRNSKPSSITSVFTTCTAKPKGYTNGVDDQKFMVAKTLDVWRNEFEATHGPIASVCADGDATNVKTHAAAGLDDDMPDGPLRSLLSRLTLLDLTSDTNLTCSNTDDQHNGKNDRP